MADQRTTGAPVPIALGITDLDVGGAERTLVELAIRLDRAAWDPVVVCLQPPGPLASVLSEHDVRVESLNLSKASQVLQAFRRWCRVLRGHRPVLLQTFLYHANLLGRFAARRCGVASVLSGLRVAERRSQWPLRLDRWTQSLVDKHVCVSEDVARFSREAAGLAPEKLVVIPNGVDIDAASAARAVDLSPLGLGSEHVKLVYVGRLDGQKGLVDLIDAAAKARCSVKQLHLILVGAGPLESTLRDRAAELDLSGAVHFVGWQSNPLDWMAAADGVILASHWEGMPNVVLEAMAVGKPVIATRAEGCSELVAPGETGWLVPTQDPDALAAAIRSFAEAAGRWNLMGQAAHLRAETFSYPQMVSRYEQLFRDVIAKSSAQAGVA